MEEKRPFVSFWYIQTVLENCAASASKNACFIDPFSILVAQLPLINIHASLPSQSACLQIRHFGRVYLCAQNNSAGMYWAASPKAYHDTQATSILTKKNDIRRLDRQSIIQVTMQFDGFKDRGQILNLFCQKETQLTSLTPCQQQGS